jgi:DNA polymerase
MEHIEKNILKFWGLRFLTVEDLTARPKPSKGLVVVDAATPEEKAKMLKELQAEFAGCAKCGLVKTKTKYVFGEGNPNAEIFFLGEGPGGEEDLSGRPFVGRAGKLLTDIIVKGMGLKREDVYIGNIVKCRPPENREPHPEEVIACIPYLVRQIQIIHPKVIVALGASAVQGLLPDLELTISKLRGHFYDYYLAGPGETSGPSVKVMPTFHPAYLLRNPPAKAYTWDDIKKVMAYVGVPIPEKK